MPNLSANVHRRIGYSPVMPDDALTLSVVGGHLQRAGQTYVLRGVNTEGVANFASFYTGGINAYIDRLVQIDSTGSAWLPNCVRLNFERYPCADSGRLYQAGDPRIPLCIPDTSQFPAWPANTTVVEGNVYVSGGQRYSAAKRRWRADKGAFWNVDDHPVYIVGDVIVGIWTGAEGDASANRVYVCTVAQTAYVPNADVSQGPHGTGTVTDSVGATWSYLGEWGTTGATQPFSGTRLFDGFHGGAQYFDGWIDNLCMWQPIGADLTPSQAETAWTDWTTNVLNPTVQRCIDNGLYCFICDFDFGPADLPLRTARMNEFWNRISSGPWKNHPRVLFDLWNESEDVGSFQGWTWTNQKPYIQATVDLIRANGATNIILCTTPAYCAFTYLATADPLTGSNIMYANHLYSDYYADTDNDTNLSIALASGQAIMCSEWGVNQETVTATVDTFIADFMGRIEAGYGSSHPAAGWMAWAFSQYWSPVFFTDGLYTTPNYYGTVVRNLLRDGGVARGVVSASENARLSETLAASIGGSGISGTSGVWVNVTPATMDLSNTVSGHDSFGVCGAASDPFRPGTCYCGCHYQGIWKSIDYGLTWSQVRAPIAGSFDGVTWSMSCSPDGAYLLANNGYGSVGGVYKSTDGGATFTLKLNADVNVVRINPWDANHALALPHGSTGDTHFYESTNAGESWTDIGSNAVGIWSDGDFIDANTFIVMSPNGLFQGVKAGGTWTWTLRVAMTGPHGGMQIHRGGDGYVYVGGQGNDSNGHIYRSNDLGASFTSVLTTGISYGPATVYGSPTHIYAQGSFATHGPYGPIAYDSTSGTSFSSFSLDSGMQNGAHGVCVMTDGSRYAFASLNVNSGIWRYLL